MGKSLPVFPIIYILLFPIDFNIKFSNLNLIYSEANRRWSMALSSMGHSQTSAQSLQSIAGGDPGNCNETSKYIFVQFF